MQRFVILLLVFLTLIPSVLSTTATARLSPEAWPVDQQSASGHHQLRPGDHVNAERKKNHRRTRRRTRRRREDTIRHRRSDQPPTDPPPPPTCFGLPATINDHTGSIAGTAGDDVIIGDDGENDIDNLGAGVDRICAGGGDDASI